MKTEEEYISVIKGRRNQLLQQLASVKKMQEEVESINSILAIHKGDTIVTTPINRKGNNKSGRNDRHKLLFDCLGAISGEGTVRNMVAHYMSIHPNENEKKIKSMLTQISSSLALKQVIGSKASKEGKGLVYFLKK